MKKAKIVLTFLLGLIFFGICGSAISVKAASGFKYKDYLKNKTITYKGTIPTYIVDGNTVELKDEPAIISERNIAYASANALFRDAMGITTKYYKSQKMISFTFMGHTLNMYMGETGALLDGEEIEAPCAPFRIKYKKSKKIATMVPSRFVAETLGMSYSWDSDTNTITVSVPYYYGVDGELVKYLGTKGKITFEGKNVELYNAPSLLIFDTVLINSESDLFKMAGIDFDYDASAGLVSLKYGVNSLHYCVGSKVVYVNGLLNRCSYAPGIFYIPAADKDILYLPGRFTMEGLGFEYVWNSETGTSEICFKKNNDKTEISLSEPQKDKKSKNKQKTTDTEKTDSDETKDQNEESSDEEIIGTGIVDDEDLADKDSKEDAKDNDSEENGSETEKEIDDGTKDIIYEDNPSLIKAVNTTEGYKFFVDKDNCKQTLVLPVPKKVKAKSFSIEEDLYGFKTELTLKGNYTKFYKKAKIENTGEAILQIQIHYLEEKNVTKIILFSDTMIGCNVTDSEKEHCVDINIDCAKNLSRKVIVLDAGHGGHDPGAQHGGIEEKDLNLKIVLYCREMFNDTDIQVYYTRTDDTFITLDDRAALSEQVGADMFIAVHHNSSNYKSVSGSSVYYSKKDTYTSLNGLTSEKLAERMLKSLTESLETKTFANGVNAENFVVVRDSKAPAVLLEIGFMSNPDELSRLTSDSFAKKAAKAIFDTVLDIYEEAM